MLNGRLRWQLLRLFKIKLLNEDGAFVGSIAAGTILAAGLYFGAGVLV